MLIEHLPSSNQVRSLFCTKGVYNEVHLVIQGLADSTNTVSHKELSETIDFCSHAWDSVDSTDSDAVRCKMASVPTATQCTGDEKPQTHKKTSLSATAESWSFEEKQAKAYIQARQLMRTEDSLNLDNFTTDIIDGLRPNLERGNLTLLWVAPTAKVNG